MNKKTRGTSDGDTIFAPPDVTQLLDQSAELIGRTRVVTAEMNKISRPVHDALEYSDKLLEARSWQAVKDDSNS